MYVKSHEMKGFSFSMVVPETAKWSPPTDRSDRSVLVLVWSGSLEIRFSRSKEGPSQ